VLIGKAAKGVDISRIKEIFDISEVTTALEVF
jgi:hypothetical protein